MAGPRQVVDAPTFTPAPYGLFSVVQTPSVSDPHWQNGVTWTSYCPEGMGAATYDECIAVTGSGGPPPEPSAKTDNVEHVIRGATPFTPYVRFDCSTVGNEEAVQVATDTLNRTEMWQVERAFWTGVVDGRTLAFPHLAANAEVHDANAVLLQTVASPVVTGTTAQDVTTALGQLEQALADCYGGQGVIHVPPKLLPTLDAHQLIRVTNARNVGSGRYDRQLQTLNGNLVAVGAGYPGTSPAGVAPATDSTWIYATGAITMRRGNVKVTPFGSAVNRDNNTVEMIAERTYVLTWDCCHFAAHVALSTP